MTRNKLFLFVILMMSSLLAQAEDFNLTEVAPGIYVHQGKHLLPTVKDMDIANVSFIVGDMCVAVLDPGGSLQLGQALFKAIRKITANPICYLIQTHIHADHVLGAAAFAEEDPTVVGHERLEQALMDNIGFFDEHFVPEGAKLKSKDLVRIPDQIVAAGQTIHLDLGERHIAIMGMAPAHTNTDLVVLDVNTRTLLMSDLLFMERIPPLDGSLNGWIKALEGMREVKAERVVPGHGPVSAKWPEASNELMNYLVTMRYEIQNIITKGGFLEEAVEKVGQSQKDKWLLFDDVHKRNVTRAFAELEWQE